MQSDAFPRRPKKLRVANRPRKTGDIIVLVCTLTVEFLTSSSQVDFVLEFSSYEFRIYQNEREPGKIQNIFFVFQPFQKSIVVLKSTVEPSRSQG